MLDGQGSTRPRLAVAIVAALAVTTLGMALAAVAVHADPPAEHVRTIGLAASGDGPADPLVPTTTTAATTVTTPVLVVSVPSSTTTTVPRPHPSTTVAPATSTSRPGPDRTTTTSPVATTTTTSSPASRAAQTWSGGNNGITIRLRMEPGSPRVGETVHFTYTATYSSAYCCVTAFYPGDGTLVRPEIPDAPCSLADPTSYAGSADHVYTAAGAYPVEVQPSVFGLCTPGPPVVVNAQLWATVVVAPAV